jgi:4-azaleucine resistance transporter AzlC
MDMSTTEITAGKARAVSNRLRLDRTGVRDGFLAAIPLWPGIIAFAMAFAITARTAGFSALEVQALSMVLFAGSAQIVIVALTNEGAGFLAIVLTVLALNSRHVLYGFSLSRWLPERARPGKPILAFFLTDEAYGLTTKGYLQGRSSLGFYLGVCANLYLVYNASTFAGVVAGGLIPNPEQLGLDFVFSLTFVALLVPLLKTRCDLRVAAIAVAATLVLSQVATSGLVILLATATAATSGALLDRRTETT